MAQVEYTARARLPIPAIWDFVQEMDNWAPFVTGYQTHEKQSRDDSVWTLKGDLGVMSRTLTFNVKVTEWAGPERVTFTLTGVNEPLEGSGEFVLAAWEEAGEGTPGPAKAGSPSLPAPTEQKQSGWRRLLAAIARFFFRLRHGRAERASTADLGPGAGMIQLHFRLRLQPGGPMAPMIDAMIAPMLQPAAEKLAEEILAEVERRTGER
jgi:carbon monoxide dehydrogenase subunit G